MDYIEIHFNIHPADNGKELLLSKLILAGYDGFIETQYGFITYVPENEFDAESVYAFGKEFGEPFQLICTHQPIRDRNWNKDWEKSFQPVMIANHCYIRASFHSGKMEAKYNIIIDPKMSFGTGHHETTALMIENLLELDVSDRKVLDIGCGTAILSILAEKMGAASVTAIDNDVRAYHNALENIVQNHCVHIRVEKRSLPEMTVDQYDVILANINLRVIMNEICLYADRLNKEGCMLLSGFYKRDVLRIKSEAAKNGLECTASKYKNDWACVLIKKKA